MRKILVLRGGALGDFIVTLPALALLRQRWPHAWIELVGNATAAALAQNRGLLNAVHSQHEARWSGLFGPEPMPKLLADYLSDFDLVLNFWPDSDDTLRRRFPLHAQQIFLSAEAMPTCAPAAAHYCAPLHTLGLKISNHDCRLEVGRIVLNPPPQDVRTPSQRIENNAPHPIAIHPGSGSPQKNWPADRWLLLIEKLSVPVLLILGEAEQERWSGLPSTRLGSSVRILSQASLESLISEFSGCRFFLGHDSGISHLAAACGLPSLLLFGPTDPKMWAPPAPHVHVLQRGPDLAAISVEDVLAELRRTLLSP